MIFKKWPLSKVGIVTLQKGDEKGMAWITGHLFTCMQTSQSKHLPLIQPYKGPHLSSAKRLFRGVVFSMSNPCTAFKGQIIQSSTHLCRHCLIPWMEYEESSWWFLTHLKKYWLKVSQNGFNFPMFRSEHSQNASKFPKWTKLETITYAPRKHIFQQGTFEWMIFLFSRWDILLPWRVVRKNGKTINNKKNQP